MTQGTRDETQAWGHEPPDLRSRRKRRTTETIRRAALDLVRRHGLADVTVEMIAEEAGISLRSFFNYFKYKEEALLTPPVGFPAGAAAEFVAGKGPLLDDLCALLAEHLQNAQPEREDIALIMELAGQSPRLLAVRERIFAHYEDEFRALVARRMGLAETDRQPQLLAAVIGAAFRVAIQRWVARGEGQLIDEVRAVMGELPDLFDEKGHHGPDD